LIAIDTNVLLRYLLWDDEVQATKANLLVSKAKFCIAQKHESFGGIYTFDIAAQQMPWTKYP
jgi:hypothetical protein